MAINFPTSPTIGDIYSDVTSGISYTWDGTRWAGNVGQPPTSPTYVQTAGDTMTGDLTSPNLTATNIVKAGDHMEGVYTVETFLLEPSATSADFTIPGWCNKIEIDMQDWFSSPSAPAYILLLNGGSTLALNTAGTRSILTWGTGFAGSLANPWDSSTQSSIYGINADLTHGVKFAIGMADGYNPGATLWRCNYTGTGTYVYGSVVYPWMTAGQMLATNNGQRPSALRIGSNFNSVGATVGTVRLFA